MKHLVFMFLSILYLPLLGQARNNSSSTKIKVSETFYATPDKIYVDSVETILSKTYLDLNNIEEVRMFIENRESLHNPRGVTLITRKKKIAFVSLADLYSKLNGNDTVPVKFMVDEEPLKDTSDVRFEPSVIEKINMVIRYKPVNVGQDLERSIDVFITTKRKQTFRLN
ncbi:hypothetical protein [Pedobacter glucosidilyticus]|uniref:hypothetical protein n=1 Tax=Pedobacter glucosidilyticus TaxID=1122941 RepID=UPI0026F00565|nr:hypothetical protein [Pedobacter glucosidilyticus]